MSKRNPADNYASTVTPSAKKLITAWKRLRTTLEEFGRQKQRPLVVTRCSENVIHLRRQQASCPVTLTCQDEAIIWEMGDVHDSIQLVRIKPNGVAYRLAGTVYTATRLSLELLARYETHCPNAVAVEVVSPLMPSLASPVTTEHRTPEEIVRTLRRITVKMAAGASLEATCSKLGISEFLFHQWHREYSGLDIRFAKRLTQLEKENEELRRQIVDLKSLEKADWENAPISNLPLRSGLTSVACKVAVNGPAGVPPRSAVRGSCG